MVGSMSKFNDGQRWRFYSRLEPFDLVNKLDVDGP